MRKCLSNQSYSYALNATGIITHIRYANKDESYKCPGCGNDMIPHMGKIRKWHFVHKAESYCNFETYLHKVAKVRIRQKFLSSDKFFITFDPLHYCSKEDCPIRKEPKCRIHIKRTFEIRRFYDICEEEIEYKGFRPDLLLRSSAHPEWPPIFIEIHVTHKSSASKIDSGLRIIEISIKHEDDITQIISSTTLKGTLFNSIRYSPKESKIVFFNFNKTYLISPSDKFYEQKYVFALKDNGDFTYSHFKCFEEIGYLYPLDLYNLIVSSVPINWLWAFSEFHKRGLVIKNCLRCKFCKHTPYGERICTLYKKHNTPQSPQIKQADSCYYFKF